MNNLVLVAAMAQNRVIGLDNKIPWNLPEDMKHFREVTLGHAIIMGRLTCESLKKPLSKRRNIVITRDFDRGFPDGFEVVHSLEAAHAIALTTDDSPRVIGGGQIYSLALPHAKKIYLTVLNQEYEGDVKFPELKTEEWKWSTLKSTDSATYYELDRV